MMMRKEIGLWGIAGTFVILAILALFIDIAELKQWVLESGPWAPLVFIALKITSIVVAPLSGGPLYPLAGMLFGFWPAVIYLGIGDFLGYSAAFWISRIFGQKIIQKMISENEESTLAKIMSRLTSAKGLFIATVIFFPFPELVSYATGLTKMRYPTFILILWPLWIIATSALIFLGAHFDSLL